jgi:hypothetical protein
LLIVDLSKAFNTEGTEVHRGKHERSGFQSTINNQKSSINNFLHALALAADQDSCHAVGGFAGFS